MSFYLVHSLENHRRKGQSTAESVYIRLYIRRDAGGDCLLLGGMTMGQADIEAGRRGLWLKKERILRSVASRLALQTEAAVTVAAYSIRCITASISKAVECGNVGHSNRRHIFDGETFPRW